MNTETISTKDVLQKICNDYKGVITPDIVLKEAKKKSSPLHIYFEWDDTEAGKRYRIIQAGNLIRSVRVTYDKNEEVSFKVRAFVNVVPIEENEEGTKIYIPIHEALNTPSYREQLLADAKIDADSFVKKYKVLNEVKDIIDAINNKNW